MKSKNIKTRIEKFLQAPLKLLFILFILVAGLVVYDHKIGIIVGMVVVIYSIAVLVMYYSYKPMIMMELVGYAFEQGQIQRELLKELAVPYALIDIDGLILWHNDEFENMVGETKVNKDIHYYFPHITKDMFPDSDSEASEFSMAFDDRQYQVQFRTVSVDINVDENDEDIQMSAFDNAYENTMIVVYFFDETDYRRLLQENKDQRLVASLIYIDNYDEVLESTDEVRQPLLMALVDRKINKSVLDINGIIKKPEKDKYFIVFQQKYLAQLQANKFDLLDEVRNINVGNELPVTLSMSIGMGESSFQECYESARIAMDMALGRGGDQVVIKEGEKTSYYGGQNRVIEKNTRVKARVKAHALQGIIEAKERVVIMGHKLPDADAIGSAIGIYKLAKVYNKEAHIVLDEATISIRPILENFENNSQYEEMFINSVTAKELVDMDTLLMIVDVNRPSYTECPELLELTKTVVVFDHHRAANEVVSNAVLSYVEPYASSACEMVAEVLQYTNESIDLKSIEADAMYAGILVDTNNFVQKTGSRTFEAAAYLRRKGADVVRVRKMFRDSIETCRSRAEAIHGAYIYREKYAMAVFPSEGVDSPTVISSQVADELLNIKGIGASFVVSSLNDTIYISARSIDVINVQLVMEKFDGGGHANAAGAQLTDCTPEEALDRVKAALDEMDEINIEHK